MEMGLDDFSTVGVATGGFIGENKEEGKL